MTAPAPGTRAERQWVIIVPEGTPLLTANHRMNRFDANRRTQDLKALMIWLCRQAKLPKLSHASFAFSYASPPRRTADRHPLASERVEDPDAMTPTGKALIDGTVKAGVLPADTKRYVGPVTYSLAAEVNPRGQLTVTITGTEAAA